MTTVPNLPNRRGKPSKKASKFQVSSPSCGGAKATQNEAPPGRNVPRPWVRRPEGAPPGEGCLIGLFPHRRSALSFLRASSGICSPALPCVYHSTERKKE
ncbi:hypothetical protein NFJ02_25g57840 [Pycnococcus provasolii]